MSEFSNALESGDIAYLQRYWREAAPNLPQPSSYAEAEFVIHYARTSAESVSLNARAYSHRWLGERLLPSGLPDELKPEAERIYPITVEAVGISVNTNNPDLRPAALEVRKAMENAAEDAYANGDTDPTVVQARMMVARRYEWKRLLG